MSLFYTQLKIHGDTMSANTTIPQVIGTIDIHFWVVSKSKELEKWLDVLLMHCSRTEDSHPKTKV